MNDPFPADPTLPPYRWVCDCPSPQDTERLAAGVAAVIQPGLTVALHGELGAGKTYFVQSLAEALGVTRQTVVSPTFVLCQQYLSRLGPIHHWDVYRLSHEDEFLEIGGDELLANTAIHLIEWAERIAAYLPPERWDVTIELQGPNARRFQFVARGSREVAMLQRLESPQPEPEGRA